MTPAETLLTEIRDAVRELVTATKAKKPVVAWTGDKTIAPDSELDHPVYGDPVVKTAPRDWTGPFTSGQRMSESAPALLDLLAEMYDYFAQKDDREKAVTDKGVPKSKYGRARAAKARGWAARIRKGYKPPAPPPMDEMPDWGGDDSAPF